MAEPFVIPILVTVAALVLLGLAAGGAGVDSRPGVCDDHQRMHAE
jgi:hypothetical protein